MACGQFLGQIGLQIINGVWVRGLVHSLSNTAPFPGRNAKNAMYSYKSIFDLIFGRITFDRRSFKEIILEELLLKELICI